MIRGVEMALWIHLMGTDIQDTKSPTNVTASVFTRGQTGETILDSGWRTKKMVMVSLCGLMDINMKENLQITRNLDREYIHGQMERCIRGSGRMTRKTAKESLPNPTAKRTKANSKMTREMAQVQ
jgi:hypothetical protein